MILMHNTQVRKQLLMRKHLHFVLLLNYLKLDTAWTKSELNSLMAEWLGQAPKRHEMYFHYLEVMDLNPGWVELEVHCISV